MRPEWTEIKLPEELLFPLLLVVGGKVSFWVLSVSSLPSSVQENSWVWCQVLLCVRSHTTGIQVVGWHSCCLQKTERRASGEVVNGCCGVSVL